MFYTGFCFLFFLDYSAVRDFLLFGNFFLERTLRAMKNKALFFEGKGYSFCEFNRKVLASWQLLDRFYLVELLFEIQLRKICIVHFLFSSFSVSLFFCFLLKLPGRVVRGCSVKKVFNISQKIFPGPATLFRRNSDIGVFL